MIPVTAKSLEEKHNRLKKLVATSTEITLTTPDFDKQLNRYQDNNIKLTGVRERRFAEIRALREIFVTMEPARVPNESLASAYDMFSKLALKTSTKVHLMDLFSLEEGRMIKLDLYHYGAAVMAIAEVDTDLHDPYPFNDWSEVW
jgi:hypothetical protein